MSSIIKSHRILQETVIDLGKQKVPAIIVQQEEVRSIESDVDTTAIYEQAQAEAMQIVAQARSKADELLQEANQTIQEQHQQAYQEIQMQKDQMEITLQQMQQQTKEEVGQIMAQAYEQKEDIILQAEPEVIKLVQRLVTHIVHEEVTKNTDWVRLVLDRIRQEESLREPIELLIHPQIYEQITQQEKERIEKMGEGVRLHHDETITPTTCMIQTTHGQIVYDIEQGLARVLKELEILESL
ncbi:MAG: FliH/SctL family protein [Cellulosilyticaceae bacterium]